ncbi:MAG TPA: hypothetical protein PLQ71_08835 [Nitrospira sp.]|nr:hypothetical protein [Nitrospira sp.]
MGKLNENLQVPLGVEAGLRKFLYDQLQAFARKVNGLSSGTFAAVDGVGTAAPTTGTWAVGDFIRNSSPSEAGAASSKFVVLGWVCVTAGTPGTWVDVRTLTGN